MDLLKIEIVCSNIRIERLRSGFTQEYLAYKLGISQNCFHKLESGKTSLKVSTLIEISQTLNVPIGRFFEFDL